MRRTIGIVAGATLIMSALLTGTGQAAKACKPFKPVAPPGSASTDPSGAIDAPVVKITEKSTESNPLVIEYEHSVALADGNLPDYPAEDPKYFNFQVKTRKPSAALNFRAEWTAPSISDIDLWLFNSDGNTIRTSVSYNPFGGTPVGDVFGMEDDGNGFEQITGVALARCAGVTFESRPATTPGESMTLKVWIT